jgi:hypothetical protein
MILLWLIPGAVADPAVDDADEEITVWGDAVDRAKDAVVAEITGLGYTDVRKRDGRTVFLADKGWKGKVVFFDDGRLATRRRGLSVKELEPIGGTRIRPYPLCLIAPTACIDAGSWYVANARWRQNEDAVARATSHELVTLGDRIADASLAESLELLPDRLERLWRDGAPLDGDQILPTFQARRAALLTYWDTRTETLWGRQVREAVAAFVRAEVQFGDHPYTADEQAAFERTKHSVEPFPWSVPR